MAMNKLISTLQKAEAFGHAVGEITLLETHISWVILTGQFAYKIKKPVNFGFLDFSTLEKRRHYCKAELKLNKKLAPEIYLDVVPITGDESNARMDGEGEAIEYAVKMLEFPQDHQLDKVLAAGKLTLKHMRLLANRVATFHQNTELINNSDYGSPETIYAVAKENFTQILEHIQSSLEKSLLQEQAKLDIEALHAWTRQSYSDLKLTFQKRKDSGYIRACHGDMHLRNMAILHDDIVIFDCIEFNDSLRFIDVMSEIAFVVMDLQFRGLTGYAMYFLNQYLSITGDYSGLKLLKYYLTYRAIVRAKVDILQAEQNEKASALVSEYNAYMALANKFTQSHSPKLLITHGLSGSGKSTFTNGLLQYLPAIRLRSDVERKRLYDIDTLSRTHSSLGEGIYNAEASEKTYKHLSTLAADILNAGWHVIVDVTFLKYSQRVRFLQLAQNSGVDFIILNFSAPESELRQRIIARDKTGGDASEANLAVLKQQLRSQEDLNAEELEYCFSITDNSDISAKMVSEKLVGS